MLPKTRSNIVSTWTSWRSVSKSSSNLRGRHGCGDLRVPLELARGKSRPAARRPSPPPAPWHRHLRGSCLPASVPEAHAAKKRGRPGCRSSAASLRDRRPASPPRPRAGGARNRGLPSRPGPIIRSTEECEMSLSCQSATFSSAGMTAERTTRASPVRFSVSTGLRLCGMAEEPFWPAEKNSSASRNSVRCKCRISTASRSTPLAITPSTAKNMACRSRGITCVECGLGREAQLLRHMGLDAGIDAGERADGAGNGAGRNLRPRGLQAGAVAGEFGIVPGQLDAEGGGLRVDSVATADTEREFVLVSLLSSGQTEADQGRPEECRWHG